MTSKGVVRTGRTLLVAVRLPFEMVDRLDAWAARASLPGLTVTRADAVRAAIAAGLASLEQGQGLAERAKGKRPKS